MGPMHWIRGWGLAYGIYPWDNALVIGDLMGRHFRVGCGSFSWGGGAGEEDSPGHTAESFSQETRVFKRSHCLLIIIYSAVEVSLLHANRRERCPRSSMPWAAHV